MRWWIVLALVACKENEPPQVASGSAPGPVSPPAAAPLVKLGGPGASLHVHQLVARADGGFVLQAGVYETMAIGSLTAPGRADNEAAATLVGIRPHGEIAWVYTLDGWCTNVPVATHGQNTLLAGSCTIADGRFRVVVTMLDGAGKVVWTKQPNGPAQQYVEDVAFDAAGNVLIAGGFGKTLDFGTGPLRAEGTTVAGYVAAFAPDGKPLWARAFAGGGIEAIAPGRDEIVLAGSPFSEGNRFVARLGRGGEPRGEFAAGTGTSVRQQLVRTAAGGLYLLADAKEGMLLFAITDHAQELATIGRDDRFTGAGDLAVDTNTLWIAGTFKEPFKLGGTSFASRGGTDVFVVKLDAAGKLLAHTQLGDTFEDNFGGIAVDPSGHVFVATFAKRESRSYEHAAIQRVDPR